MDLKFFILLGAPICFLYTNSDNNTSYFIDVVASTTLRSVELPSHEVKKSFKETSLGKPLNCENSKVWIFFSRIKEGKDRMNILFVVVFEFDG